MGERIATNGLDLVFVIRHGLDETLHLLAESETATGKSEIKVVIVMSCVLSENGTLIETLKKMLGGGGTTENGTRGWLLEGAIGIQSNIAHERKTLPGTLQVTVGGCLLKNVTCAPNVPAVNERRDSQATTEKSEMIVETVNEKEKGRRNLPGWTPISLLLQAQVFLVVKAAKESWMEFRLGRRSEERRS